MSCFQGILSQNEQEKLSKLQDEHKHLLQIPRRPQWDETTSKDELEKNEKASFLTWRRQLATVCCFHLFLSVGTEFMHLYKKCHILMKRSVVTLFQPDFTDS